MSEKNRTMIGTALLAVSIVLIIIGINSGEPATVLGKAIKICMECIGIG